jgi:hypothetical protein
VQKTEAEMRENIEVGVKQLALEGTTGLIWLRIRPQIVGCCEYGNEHSGTVRGQNLCLISDHYLWRTSLRDCCIRNGFK